MDIFSFHFGACIGAGSFVIVFVLVTVINIIKRFNLVRIIFFLIKYLPLKYVSSIFDSSTGAGADKNSATDSNTLVVLVT